MATTTEPEQTPEYHLGVVRSRLADQMAQRNEYRQQIIGEIVRHQEALRVNEDLLKMLNAELDAMNAALQAIPTSISH